LQEHAHEITSDYINKRSANPSHRFQWPRREKQSVYEVVRSHLSLMTDGHCSYCDGFPINDTGQEQVDHFRPKSLPEFYALVCSWENLFLVCSACNHSKQDQWDNALLKPDDPEYSFLRYFSYVSHTGELIPNAAATPDDQQRANRTIAIFDLNRAGACKARMRMVRSVQGGIEDDSYRYLMPLCCPESCRHSQQPTD